EVTLCLPLVWCSRAFPRNDRGVHNENVLELHSFRCQTHGGGGRGYSACRTRGLVRPGDHGRTGLVGGNPKANSGVRSLCLDSDAPIPGVKGVYGGIRLRLSTPKENLARFV